MIWALDGQVAAPGRGGRPPGDRRRGRGGAAHLQRGARPGHRRRGPQRRVRRERAAARRRRARPLRARAASSTSTPSRWCSTCCRARSAPGSRTTLRAEHGVTLGHWPQSIDLSTVGGWLACRGAGQLSHPLREDRGHGRRPRRRARRRPRDPHRRARRGPRSGPTSPSCSSGREGTLGIITGARLRLHPAPAVRAAGRVRVRVASPTGSTRAGASCTGRDARGAAPLRRDRGRPQLPDRRPARAARAGRGRPRARRRDDGRRRRGVRRRRRDDARRRARRAVDGAPQRRERARGAHLARLRRRHDGDRGAVVAAAPPIYDAATAAIAARAGARSWRRRTCRTAYPDGACLYFTFAGQPAGRRAGTRSTAPRGTPGPGPCSRTAAR